MKNSSVRKCIIWKKLFFDILKITKFHGVFTIFCTLVNALFPMIILMCLTNIYNFAELFINGKCSSDILLHYTFILVFIYLIKKVLDFFSSISINAFIYEKCKKMWLSKIIEKTSELELIKYEEPNVMDEIQRVKDVISDEVPSSLFMNIISIASLITNIIFIIITLGTYNWFLVILSILSVIPFLISRLIRGNDFYKLKWYQSKKNRKKQYLYSLFSQKETIKEIRIFGTEEYFTQKFVECRREINDDVWQFRKKDSFSLMLCDLFKILTYGLCICFVVYLIYKNYISIAVFSSCLVAIQNVQNSLKNILIKAANINTQSKMVKDFYHFIEDNFITKNKLIIKKTDLINGISIENVNFSYPNSNVFAVNDVSFYIKKGEKVAIVGENGSGKTTLIKLLLGLYSPDSGSIYYDDILLEKKQTEKIYDLLSICQQKFTKYKFSIKENICISDINKKCSEDDLKKLLQYFNLEVDSDLSEVIAVDFGGCDFSEGQWQKLAIARACYRNHKIIFIDEPTASIDPLSEFDIINKILDISTIKTSIIISHRLSVCTLVDKVIVMDKGKIVGIGTHSELICKNKMYQKLFNAQKELYEEEKNE